MYDVIISVGEFFLKAAFFTITEHWHSKAAASVQLYSFSGLRVDCLPITDWVN